VLAEQKAARDARYAARKAPRRTPPRLLAAQGSPGNRGQAGAAKVAIPALLAKQPPDRTGRLPECATITTWSLSLAGTAGRRRGLHLARPAIALTAHPISYQNHSPS